jgi:hypothetical protein
MNTDITRAAQILFTKFPWQLNCVWWHLIMVGPQFATWFMALFWQLKILGGSQIYEHLHVPGYDHLLTYMSAIFSKIKCLTTCLASFPNSQVSNHVTLAQSFNGLVFISVSLFPDSPVRLCLCHIPLLCVV